MSLDIVAMLPVAFIAVVFGYALFSLFGFGSGILAGPGLMLVMPMARIVPLLAMLDAGSSVARAWRGRRSIRLSAIRVLLPCMLLGQLVGISLLHLLPVRETALLFGSFIAVLGLSSFWPGRGRSESPAGLCSGIAHGLAGGVFGGVFASGGFMYARYLQQKVPERERYLATQSVMIGLSTAWRVVLCIVSGLVDTGGVMMAIVLAPAVWTGFRIGAWAQAKISPQRWLALLNGLLIVAGLLLAYRYLDA